MKEKLKKLLTQKREGSVFVEAAIVSLTMSLFLAGSIFLYALWMHEYTIKETVDFALTNSMKIMETQSSDSYESIEESLVNELLDEGIVVTSLTCGATGVGPADEPEYGAEIHINFVGYYDYEGNVPSKELISSLRKIVPTLFGADHFKLNLDKNVTGTKKC